MACTMLTTGTVKFQGRTIVLGETIEINGEECTPFFAWVRDNPKHTTIRVKWANTQGGFRRLSDFSDVYGKKAVFTERRAAA